MPLQPIAGLWKATSKSSGREYLRGKAQQEITIPAGAQIMLFRNDSPKSDNSPQYNVLVEVPEEEAPVGPSSSAPPQQRDEYTPPSVDEVPF